MVHIYLLLVLIFPPNLSRQWSFPPNLSHRIAQRHVEALDVRRNEQQSKHRRTEYESIQ